MMVSLTELANTGQIEKTGAKPKLPIKIDGISSDTLDVYKIPLNYLYYNDKNGRIATGIAQIDEEIHPSNDTDDSSYNNLVAQLIENDSKAALKKTMQSIEESGQQVYGYVLNDGRIVDGNRRFTALRKIHQRTGKSLYFEAVLLPFSYSNTAERIKIKRLELAIQMGVEERKSYDPVDLAVDIYQTTAADDSFMTRADFAADSRMRLSEVEKYYQGAYYVRQFLDFIGASKNNYSIIKETKTWAMFYEMGKSLASNFGDDEESQVRRNETMESYFGIVLHEMHVGVSDNTARNHVRDYTKNVVKTQDNQDFNDDVSDTLEDLSDSLQEMDIQDTSDLMRGLSEEHGAIDDFGETFDTYIRNAKNGESVEKFIESIKQSVRYYQGLNDSSGLVGALRYSEIKKSQLTQLQEYMRDLNQVSRELFEKYGDEIK